MKETHEPDAAALARLLAQLSGDLVLVVDTVGQVTTVACGDETPAPDGAHHWVGRAWVETVTPETRHKVGRMLQELAQGGRARRRELNHPRQDGSCAAFAYHAVRLGGEGPCLALGRDLSEQSALQQRLLQAQREALTPRRLPSR